MVRLPIKSNVRAGQMGGLKQGTRFLILMKIRRNIDCLVRKHGVRMFPLIHLFAHRFLNRSLLLIVCLASVNTLLGENTFRFTNMTTKEGLSQNTVRCISQDSRGYMWLGTLNGLNRFDGSEFVVLMPKYGEKSTLSDNRIKGIHEDQYGYLWVQTNIDHINCYNTNKECFVDIDSMGVVQPYSYLSPGGDVWLWGGSNGCLQVTHADGALKTTHFGKDLIRADVVNFVFETSNGMIWFGTNNKLFTWQNQKLIQRAEGSDFSAVVEIAGKVYVFTNSNRILVLDLKSKTILSDLAVSVGTEMRKLNDVVVIAPNQILITTKGDIYLFNTQNKELKPANFLFKGNPMNNAFVHFDNRNSLWIYNKSGSIWQLNPKTVQFNEIKLIPPPILSFIDLERYDVWHDSRDIIWISTYGNGLFAIDQRTGKTTHFNHDKNQLGGLNSNFLLSITEDTSGEMWVGTEYAGLSKISVSSNEREAFYPEGELTAVEDKIIRMIHEDDFQNLWVGTKQGNLYIFNAQYQKLVKHVIDGGMPYVMTQDSAGNNWVGTKGKGLLIFNKGDYQHFVNYTASGSDVKLLNSSNIYAICRDSKQRMWLGTFGSGLLLAERNNGELTFRRFPEMRKIQSRIRTIIQDNRGYLWVGGNSGVVVFNPDELVRDETKFVSFSYDSKQPQSISNNEVKCIFEDHQKRIWLGTSGGGINEAIGGDESIERITFKHFSSADGLINDIVQGIQEDESGHLWITTENGISKYDVTANQFKNLYFSDHWEGDLFCESAIFKCRNGELLFGSYDGMYRLNTKELNTQKKSSPVLITGLNINGTRVTPGDHDSPLTEAIGITSKIRLRYDQNSFNIQFAILDYLNPAANSFTYILEGYEKEWNPVTRHNVATYRNIPAGTYTFKVKGSNSLGVWNSNETTLEIVVVPPLWRSPQALILYFILTIIVEFIAIRLVIKFNRLNSAVKMEQQLTDYKLRFFTNISHEFRTPLTIIRGTIENLSAQPNLSANTLKQLGFLEKSSLRLLRLINQLLEFRRLENDKMALFLEPTEIVSFFREMASNFDELAAQKQIEFKIQSNVSDYTLPIDRGVMDKVVYNLLSNAFKFTPSQGHIDLNIDIDELNQIVTVQVADNGIGVSKEKQTMLFKRFKQPNPSSTGTGIGLHLASELIKEHKGSIRYDNSKWGGACLTVTFPLSEQAYSTQELMESESEKKIDEFDQLSLPDDPTMASVDLEQYRQHKLLIIEDDTDICEFLQSQLSQYFQVDTAPNGLVGLEKCKNDQPDLVVCDVMMPEMNGFEVTNRLKSELNTCHIPIILLTAHASLDHQLKGIEAGADSYITKPFSIKYLLLRIVKLIEHRKKLQQKFVQEPGLFQLPEVTVDKDNEFLKLTLEVIEKNLQNTDFTMEEFSATMNMGRTIFYKKIKTLTGFTPNEYLRVVRMKHAAELLNNTNLNVSEVAYRVGFNSPFYFSKCFKEQFGITPSDYAKKGSV